MSRIRGRPSASGSANCSSCAEAAMPDVTCDLSVDNDRVWLRFDDDAEYAAPVRHDPLVKLLVKRLDRFVTHHDPGLTGYEDTDLKLLGAALFNILFGQEASKMEAGRRG